MRGQRAVARVACAACVGCAGNKLRKIKRIQLRVNRTQRGEQPLVIGRVGRIAHANHQPVGLLYAGSSSLAIANPIQDVINAFKPTCGGNFSFVGLTCTPITYTSATGTSSTNLANANKAKDRHVRGLMSSPAVLGVGVGAAEDGSGETVVRVYVERGQATPPIPATLDGVRVEVVHTDPIVALSGSAKCSDR